MESKKGAFIVLGLLLVVTVVLLIVCAKRGGQGDPDFKRTLESWKKGLLASLAKSQQLAASELEPNPFNKTNGEATLTGPVTLTCKKAKSEPAVRRATLELAGPGQVEVTLVAKREKGDLKCHKKLLRTTASGDADEKAKFKLVVFEGEGTLTLAPQGVSATPVKLRWTFE